MEEHTILVVVDGSEALRMIKATLLKDKHRITETSSSRKAMDLIGITNFDLVIADMAMAPVGGLEVLRKTKEISPETMVILLTSHEDMYFPKEALSFKADDYLIKPIDPKKLSLSVSSCLEQLRLKRKAADAQQDLYLFKAVLDGSNEAIVISDPNGRILYVNAVHEKLFGHSPEIARSLNYRAYYTESSIIKHNKEIVPALKKGGPWEGMVEVLDSEKRHFPVWQRVCVTNDDEGELRHCFSFMHKIKQRETEKKFYQAQQAQAMGTLAGGIAHEFNNILWIIMANAEIVADGLPEGHAALKNLRRVERACSRGKDLVQQILSFSRQGEHRPRPLDIVPIVKESLKFLRSSIPTTIEIRQNLSTQSATILSDPSQVNQTIINLCVNATDAIGEKSGVLEVSLKDVEFEQDKTALPYELTAGKYVRLSVKDNGIGMAPEVRERIFEPFFTTKNVGEGKGMGLAVVHGIVKNCEGAIEVQSEPGKGSTFHVFFPKIEKKSRPEIASPIPSLKETGRILFVDDDEDVAKVGKDILERFGYQVQSQTLPEKALEIFRDRPGEFDLIITDMMMPRMTGIELGKESMRIRPDIPVILCTGHHEGVFNDSAMATGIKVVIMKPVRRDHLIRAVRKALKGC